MKNLSCAVAFLILGSTNASETIKVKIDCKHPDTDHETTDEDSVYVEFFGTESDDRIIGEYWDNPSRSFVDRAEWVVKGTSNCDGSLKNWVSPK